jgi:hypothetical protein
MAFPILVDALTPVLQNDPTVNSCNAITTGKVTNCFIGSLHDVIRICCMEIEKARHQILIVSSYWEGISLSAFMLCRSLRWVIRNYPHIELKIVVDNGTLANIGKPGNVRVIPKPNWKNDLGLYFDDISKDVNVAVKSIHVPLLGTMHAKFLVIDDKSVVLSSNNVQDRPNVEMAITFQGSVVYSFQDIFFRLFHRDICINGNNFINKYNLISNPGNNDYLCCHGNQDHHITIVLVCRKMHGGLFRDVISPQTCAWWTMMSLAKKSILISTPTLNAEHAIEAVISACKRKVNVKLVLTKNFNDKKEALPFQGGTNQSVIQKMTHRLRKLNVDQYLTVKWYVGSRKNHSRKGTNSHVKFTSIDDKIVMIGNGNMDTQSWYHSMEVNIVMELPELAKTLNELYL